MKLGIISLLSNVHDQQRIDSTMLEYLDLLKDNFEVAELSLQTVKGDDFKQDDYDLLLTFVKTGGTENYFKEIYDRISSPVLLLATPLHNSLAASMEILSWVRTQGGQGRIIHGQPKNMVDQINRWAKITGAVAKISEGRMGLIGDPSDWLIDSTVDLESVQNSWGLEIKTIGMEEVINLYHSYTDQDVNQIADKFMEDAEGLIEPSNEDVFNAVRVYLALKEVIKKYGLTALTIRCFDLVTELNTTGCLALSLLNNEGIVAGCEGDVPAAFSMMISYYLTGQLPFMANPVEIDRVKRKIKFAHCTVPTGAVSSYIIRSHFETGIGVGIKGELPQGNITVFKIGGSKLDTHIIKRGELRENLNSSYACRTQILVDFFDDVDYFLTSPIGNHHIILPGDHSEILVDFFALMNDNLS